MPLQRQNVNIQLAAGVDTKTDPKQVVAGKLLVLENGIFTSKNRIKKRNGYDSFSQLTTGATSIISGSAISEYGNELTEFDGNEMYSYDTSKDIWLDKGRISSVAVSQRSIVRNTYQQTNADCCYHSSGVYAFAWEDSRGGVRYSVVDSATGLLVVSDVLIDALGSKPQVVAFGNFLVIFYLQSSTALYYKAIPIGNPTTIGAGVLVSSDLRTSGIYDAVVMSDRLFVGFSGVTNLVIRYYDTNLNSGTILNMTPAAASLSCMSLAPRDELDYICMAYADGSSTLYARMFDYSLTNEYLGAGVIKTVEAIVNIQRVTAVFKSKLSLQIIYEIGAAQPNNHYIRTVNIILVDPVGAVAGTMTIGTPSNIIRSVGLYSAAFNWNGNSYFFVAYDSQLQASYFLADTSGNLVAKLEGSLGGGIRSVSQLASAGAVSASAFLVAALVKDYLESQSGVLFTQTGVDGCLVDFANLKEMFFTTEMANNLHIGGGFLWMYDGATPVEHGFHVYPEGLSAAGTGTTGHNYQWVSVYEWMDNKGNTHRSAPSPVVSASYTAAITSSVGADITVPTLRLTAKQNTRSPVQVTLYRTLDNGNVFYKVTSSYNDTTVDTLKLNDVQPDSTIQGNNVLYTVGGEVENIAPNAVVNSSVYANRIILLDASNRLRLWYSKQVIPGVPVEFSDLFTINVDPRGGPATAVATLDDKLIVFKENSIFYITGQGPTPSGDQNDFSSGYLISTDGGCIDARSIVLTPDGLMFKSRKGIYLLDRSLSTKYIGAEVEAFNSLDITSAILIPNTTQIRFTLSDGTALVYDYLFQQWSTFTNIAATDACVFQNQYTYVRADGKVLQETPGVFADDGATIQLKLSTSWLSFAQLQGYQRAYGMWILGEYLGNHHLYADISYDFVDIIAQTDDIDAKTLLNVGAYGEDSPYGAGTPYGGENPLYMWGINFKRQKCSAVKITLYDVQPSPNEGLSLSVLSFDVGAKKGLNRLAPWKTFG